jgi:arylsulfatase A-like enzyme
LALDGISDGLRWSTIWAGIRFAAMERLSPLPERKRDAFLRRLRLRIDRDVFIAQLHRTHPDLASFTIYLTDALSHTHWSRDGGRYVDSAYRMSDAILGEIREAVGPETTVMVLSDHGFRNAGERPGVYAAVPKIDALESWLEGQVGEVDIVRVGRKLVVTPDVPVADEVLERVLGTLAFSDGEPLYRSEVFPRAAGWSLSIAHLPPKGDWADVEIAGVALTELVRAGRTEEGEHDPAGILVMAGPGVGQGDFGVVSQLDVMPTILAILGLPVAEDLPGTALVEERVARVPTHAGLAPAGAAAGALNNADRLRELGYID